ncbi:EAL domain-containing protein [Salinactinospora qingdaonensis]|uniref:EAL domain-containing protein n=1 Tax=Salinactinospora qingdaonensis TaxID=702744 RepID=A0ABP7EZW4_9ACTN
MSPQQDFLQSGERSGTALATVNAPSDEPKDGAPPFHPIVDLDSGEVLAIEVERPVEGGSVSSDPETDAEVVSRLVRRVAAYQTSLPLVLPIAASTLLSGLGPLALVEKTVRRMGRRPREITLVIDTDLRTLPREQLLQSLGQVRELGFRFAFGTGQIAPDLLLETNPFLFRIDASLVAGIPDDTRRSAVVEGLARMGCGSGIFPLASGVDTSAQLNRLRQVGVRLAQGPLFAGPEWLPGDRVNPLPAPPMLDGGMATDTSTTVAEYMVPPFTMAADAKCEDVLDSFTENTALNSIILLDHRDRPVGSVDRSRFLLAITGPYGHALHAKRPARRLADEPRTIARQMPALAALRVAGVDQSRERIYDDLIAVNEFGQCIGVVHVSDLIRGLSR